MEQKSRRTAAALAGTLAAGALAFVHAQSPAAEFPNKPVRFIVPFPPGGSNDVLARFVGAKLSERIGQQVVIDNRGGANGIIGTELAAGATPDGYTILMISTSYVMNAAVRKLPYDIERTFDPIAMVGTSPNSIVVNPSGPYRTARDIVAAAKSAPGKINYASTGVGGFNHFGGELFNKVAGIRMTMVPYKGGGPAMVDVMAENIPVMFSSVTQVLPHVRSGRLKVVAVGSRKRTPVLPEVPTVIESGFPDYEVAVWWGITAPAGVPRTAAGRLEREINALLATPDSRKRLLADAAEPVVLSPGEIRRMIRDDRKKWTTVARQAGIKVQ